jgi:hypothetical protein
MTPEPHNRVTRLAIERHLRLSSSDRVERADVLRGPHWAQI